MTVLEKSKLLVNPQMHMEAVKESVRMDKTSILSGSMGSNGGYIAQKSLQEKMIKKSIRMLYPNAQKSFLEQSKLVMRDVVSKCGSPGPKTTKHNRLSMFSGLNPQQMPVGADLKDEIADVAKKQVGNLTPLEARFKSMKLNDSEPADFGARVALFNTQMNHGTVVEEDKDS